MKERLLEFLKNENKSSAQLAEEIGVQPSGISHILSGRNNPSLDFVLKMLEKYPFISTEWFLFGKGFMYKDPKIQSLFNENLEFDRNSGFKALQKEETKSGIIHPNISENEQERTNTVLLGDNLKSITRIVWFYSDNTFQEYFPQH
jgi:transcriptional regulator with XRE-family HTH domain